MWKAAAAVKDEWREGLASGGETFLEKSFSPEPPFSKGFRLVGRPRGGSAFRYERNLYGWPFK